MRVAPLRSQTHLVGKAHFYCKNSGKQAVRAYSSAGRAHALQAWGHRFEPGYAHQMDGPVVQLVRMPACHAGGRRFEPVPGRQNVWAQPLTKHYLLAWLNGRAADL